MLIHDFLENSARAYPDKPAVWFEGKWKTYEEIDSISNRLGNHLVSSNVLKDDRVALLLDNSFEYIAGYFGILKAGAITVALKTETTLDTLVYTLNHSGAKAIITHEKYSDLLLPAISKIPNLKHVIIKFDKSKYEDISRGNPYIENLTEILKTADDRNVNVRSIDIDLASIVYTSGSTGKPKGVMLTHRNVVSNTISITKYLQLNADDRILVVLPFYYIYGQSLLTTHFYVSGSVVIENRQIYPQLALETMRDTEVTGLAGVPSTFMIMLERTKVREFSFPKLRYLTQAGGSLPVKTQKEVVKVFPRSELFIMYGATEAAPRLTYVPPDMLSKKWGSIGRAVDNVEVFVADKYGNKINCNQEGEIVARGSNIMAGYWRDPKGTAKVLRDGLYFTGDLGVMDDDGFIYVVGRKKDIIKSGGFRVSSKEVEEALLATEKISEVAVIGVVDEILGEAIKAYIVPRPGMNLCVDMLKKNLKKLLPPFKHPKYFEIIKALPKNQSGKIMKTRLS